MTVEVLFDEVCNLYGDGQNSVYLQKSLPEAQFIHTKLTDEPYFVQHTPNIILIGSMSESCQRRVIQKLMPLKERIEQLISDGTVFLATGNACEVFVSHISYVTEEIETDALGLFNFTVKTDLFNRYNGKVLGKFGNITITGFRSQFSFLYGSNATNYFVNVERGIGINKESMHEGFRRKNFFGTMLLGPLLPSNPLFCEYLIKLAGGTHSAAFRDAAMAAYRQRVKEFSNPETKF